MNFAEKNIILEGEIKSGKSYILNSVLKKLNIKYGGFLTYPYYLNKRRLGFKLKDILTNEESVIAIHNIDGSLIIFPDVFDDLGVRSLENGYKNCDLIVMDELGFLEENSYKFKEKVIEILNSNKRCFVVIKNKKNTFLKIVSDYGKVFKVNNENKEELIQMILKEVNQWIFMKI